MALYPIFCAAIHSGYQTKAMAARRPLHLSQWEK
jgi:hypothetical protein